MIFNIESNNSDNQTVISDITDNDITLTNENFEDKLNEIKINFNTDLNKLTMDNLKDKCKELGVIGISKFKKPELIQTLETEFFKMLPILKEKKVNELKNISQNNIEIEIPVTENSSLNQTLTQVSF